MAMLQQAVTDRQGYDTRSDREIAEAIAACAPREADGAIRALNQTYRPGAGLNFRLDPVNMVPCNPVGELLNQAYDAVRGARPPLTVAEIEAIVAWIRAHPSPA